MGGTPLTVDAARLDQVRKLDQVRNRVALEVDNRCRLLVGGLLLTSQ